MKTAPWIAIALALAVPASAAGRGGSGRGSIGRSTRLSAHPALRGGAPALRSFARTPFATRSTFVGSSRSSGMGLSPRGANGFAGFGGPSGSRVSYASSSNATPKGNVPSNGGSTSATAGTPGAPIVGTNNHTAQFGAASGGGTQNVAAGDVSQNGATAVDVGRTPGVSWTPPDTPPSGGSAGAGTGGVTTNH
jgi:hypothetical protein